MECDRCGLDGPAGMRFCGGCGAALGDPQVAGGGCGAPPGDPQVPGGGPAETARRRHVTVLFCDIVDSTPLAGRLDPEDLRDVLRGYQDACVRAIERFNGFVAQYAGDGVVAYFGYPRAGEHDAQRAVHAALDLLEEIDALNTRLTAGVGVSLAVRVGVHTGLVVADQMGAGQARELAMVGDAPYVAARLQAIAPSGAVLISESTRELVADRFQLQAIGARRLKGVASAIDVHRVLGPGPGVRDGDGDVPMRSDPMIDRAGARAELREAWARAGAGGTVVVHVAGEAGIGKSRLVRALREELAEQPAARLLQCSPHHATTALHPLIRHLEQSLDLDRSLPAAELLRRVERALPRAGLDPQTALPLLADLLSLPGASPPAAPLGPRETRNATLRALEALLRVDTGAPLLLIVEDLQWADPTTLALLERIFARREQARAVCIVTFRGDTGPPWQADLEIELGPLVAEDVRALATAVSPIALDAAELARVQFASDGIPLFAEEIVKLLAASSPRASPRTVPPTLQNLLVERLDRLPELTELIDFAAVLGRGFEQDLLEQLSALGRPRFASALARLTAEDVLRPVEGSRSRLEFKHTLLQEAAYERLVREHRRELHAGVAELLLARRAHGDEYELETIAHHLSCSDQPALAVTYWRLAGSRALSRAAFQEAAEHFRCALEALAAAEPDDADAERGALLIHLGAALQAGRGYAADGVERAYTEARSVNRRAGGREPLIPAIRGLWMFHLLRSDFPAVLELADEMLTLGAGSERPGHLAEGHLYRGLAHMYMAESERAIADLESAIAHYTRPHAPDDIYEAQGDTGVGALAYLAPMLWAQGQVHAALERSRQSLALAESIGAPMTLAQAWGMRGGLLMLTGKREEGGEWLERTRIHSEERNIVYWRTICSLWAAWMRGRAADPASAAARLRELLGSYRDSGASLGRPQFQILLADLLLAAGDRSGALEALGEGQEHIDATGERYSEPELNWLLGRALMSGNAPEPTGASAAYERALAAVSGQNARLLELRARTYLATHQREIGEQAMALAPMQSLCDSFPADLQVPDVLRARALIRRGAATR